MRPRTAERRALTTRRTYNKWLDAQSELHHLKAGGAPLYDGSQPRYFRDRQDTKDVLAALFVLTDAVDRLTKAMTPPKPKPGPKP